MKFQITITDLTDAEAAKVFAKVREAVDDTLPTPPPIKKSAVLPPGKRGRPKRWQDRDTVAVAEGNVKTELAPLADVAEHLEATPSMEEVAPTMEEMQPAPVEYTIIMMKNLLEEVMHRRGIEVVSPLFPKYNATGLKSLDPKHYPALAAEIKELLNA